MATVSGQIANDIKKMLYQEYSIFLPQEQLEELVKVLDNCKVKLDSDILKILPNVENEGILNLSELPAGLNPYRLKSFVEGPNQ